jgi:hypothetical protein
VRRAAERARETQPAVSRAALVMLGPALLAFAALVLLVKMARQPTERPRDIDQAVLSMAAVATSRMRLDSARTRAISVFFR